MLVEIEQRHLPYRMEIVISEILNYGYKGFYLLKGKMLPLSDFVLDEHQQPSNIEKDEYVNLFIFTSIDENLT